MIFISLNISSLIKKPLKEIADVINDKSNLFSRTFTYLQWYLTVTGAFESKLYEQPPTKVRKEGSQNIFEANFSSKATELINLSALFNNPELTSIIKDLPDHFVILQLSVTMH